MELNSLEEIERAIDALAPEQLARLYAWLDEHRPWPTPCGHFETAVFEQGLGLFGSPGYAALMDEVVQIAYEERRRASSRPSAVLGRMAKSFLDTDILSEYLKGTVRISSPDNSRVRNGIRPGQYR
jgi:hypothetical protein